MKIYTYLAAAALTALAAACQNDEPSLTYANDSAAVRIQPTIASINASPRANTPDAGDAWETGDIIAVRNLTTGVPAQKQTGYYRADVSESATTWQPCTAAGGTTSIYLVWEGDETNYFEAWYPAAAETANADDALLPEDQSTLEKLKAADYMTATDIEAKKADADGKLSFRMEHRRSMVTINIASYDDEFANVSERIYTNVKIHSVTSPDNEMLVTPYLANPEAEGELYSYTAIVHPALYGEEAPTLMTFTLNGVDMEVSIKGKTLEAGKAYTFHLNVGRDAVKITGISIKEWTTIHRDGVIADEVFP